MLRGHSVHYRCPQALVRLNIAYGKYFEKKKNEKYNISDRPRFKTLSSVSIEDFKDVRIDEITCKHFVEIQQFPCLKLQVV